MGRYFVRRVIRAIPILLLIATLSFIIVRATPGGPLVYLGIDPRVSKEDIRTLERQYGLDRPLPAQYIEWLASLARGDLGKSFTTHEPVWNIILERLPSTLQLTVAAALLGALVGIPLGIYAALRRGSWV